MPLAGLPECGVRVCHLRLLAEAAKVSGSLLRLLCPAAHTRGPRCRGSLTDQVQASFAV